MNKRKIRAIVSVIILTVIMITICWFSYNILEKIRQDSYKNKPPSPPKAVGTVIIPKNN